MTGIASIPRGAVAPLGSTRAPMIVLDRLTKRFPARRGWLAMMRHPFAHEQTTVLHGVTCEIAQGEFFGLLGPNGAGKTTLFKILATLIEPDDGVAIVGGEDVMRNGRAVRRILSPVIADERSLYWRVSAMANLELYGALQGLDRRAARARAVELLRIVGLHDAGDKIVGAFSSGMKQRLLIARALVGEPRVLLLDEPTRSLDPISARAFRRFLREEIAARQGCTVFLATHNTEEALELCDRVGILDRGRLLAVGTTSQLEREIGDDRYTAWTRDVEHGAFLVLEERGEIRDVHRGAMEPDGWGSVSLEVTGGSDHAAQVLAFLTAQGVRVARFERVTLSLADLIERIVERRGSAAGTDGAHA